MARRAGDEQVDVLSGGAIFKAPLDEVLGAARQAFRTKHFEHLADRDVEGSEALEHLHDLTDPLYRRFVLGALGPVTVVYEGVLPGGRAGEDANGFARALSKVPSFRGGPILSISLRSKSGVGFELYESGECVRALVRIRSGRRWDLYAEGERLRWEDPARRPLTADIVRSYVQHLHGISFPETIAALEALERRVAFQARYITDEERLRRRLAGPRPRHLDDQGAGG